MAQKTIIVISDPDIKDLVPGYWQRRLEELLTLQQHLANGDIAAIGAIAHKVKGTAASYGFPELGSIAMEIEHAANTLDKNSVQTLTKKYLNYVGSVEVQYE